MQRLLILALTIASGCYRPRVEGACEVGCDQANAPTCPNGLQCGGDGLCFDDVPCNLIDAPSPDDDAIDGLVPADCVSTILLGLVCPQTIAPAKEFPANAILNTDDVGTCTELLPTPSGPVCLFASERIEIRGVLVVNGSRPYAMFGQSSITIAAGGGVDVSVDGAGMRTDCNSGDGVDQASTTDASGGGAGGTLVGRGGTGGIGTGSAATSRPATPVTTLRGGCAGGRGGDRSNMNAGGGARGQGGGAVQLMSPQQVMIGGAVDAYGGGGGAGLGTSGQAAGGGGGGSGGIVAIDANIIIITATAFMRAHGGGGGGGAVGGGVATAGAQGTSSSGAVGGVAGGSSSGMGGTGSSDTDVAGSLGGMASSGGGAGGGGGGAGAIILHGAAQIQGFPPIHPPFITTAPP